MSRSSIRPLGLVFLLIFASGQTLAGPAAPSARTAGIAVSPSLPAGVTIAGFEGSEGISTLYRFQLDLIAPAPAGVFELLGQEVTIAVGGDSPRFFSGICSRISEGAVDREFHYRVEVVPQFWLLTLQSGSRIFQDRSVPDVLQQLFAEAGIDADFRLTGSYPARHYVVQYRESDFAFASRLMEEEGIYFFFEHSADGSVLVAGDSPSAHPSLPAALRWQGSKGKPADGIVSWEKQQELRSGKYTVDDYTFHAPSADLSATRSLLPAVQAGASLHRLLLPAIAGLEIYDFPGGYADRFDGVGGAAGEAQKTATLRMEESASSAVTIRGDSLSPLASGHRFTLGGHPNADGAYLITSVQHSANVGKDGAAYSNSFTCIPAALPFRPQRITPRPEPPGLQSAVVTGPPGEEVFTDGLGRVKVQFHWDREGRRDDRSSCWIRVVQQPGGVLHLPQVGDEVLVGFEHGDIDRPIIIGRLWNPSDAPPSD